PLPRRRDVAGERRSGLGVAHDDRGPALADLPYGNLESRLGKLRAIQVVLATEAMVEGLLEPRPRIRRTHGIDGSPEVKAPVTRAVAGPPVAAKLGRLA